MTSRRRIKSRKERGEHDGNVGLRLRQLRQEAGRTQEEVSVATGVKIATYREWENGRFVPRAGPLLRAVAEYFRVSPRFILTGEKKNQKGP